MKKLTFLFAAIIIIGIAAQVSFSQTEKEKNTDLMVRLVKLLEEEPFHEKAKDYRAGAFAYIAKTEDVTIILCEVNDQLTKKKNKFGGELLIHHSMAMAAFKLSNPDKADDENAAQLAGLESVLRAYEAMVKENKKAQYDGMDELVTKRDNGELKAFVEKADCGGKNKKKKKDKN